LLKSSPVVGWGGDWRRDLNFRDTPLPTGKSVYNDVCLLERISSPPYRQVLTKPMTTVFTKLNHGWNAEPNAPHIAVEVDGSEVTLSFFANPYQFPQFVDGQIIRLRFIDVWRYAIGDVNDEGWYRGQCRFSRIAPAWGEFYEVSGDLRLKQFDAEWRIVSEVPSESLRHFLFYFRDENFECDAVSWERIQ
jgi:hypothetical protein